MDRYLCIHGHFYQPPRENPWLEVVEQQDSAYPYHDWNERITAECYAANSASRMLSGARITQIVSNYSKISFNFGPTLLSWMEQNTPEVYAANSSEWSDVSGAKIDPTRAYLQRLPSGRSINLFFYDGPIARAVAFEGLLANGEGFANRLLSGFSDERTWPQLVHIATDGETY